MAREDTPLDQETFDKVLADELAKGTDRRVAEGRARSAAVRALRAKSGEASAAAPAAASAAAPPGESAPVSGDGGAVSGGAEPPATAAAPASVAPAAAPRPAAAAPAAATTVAPASAGTATAAPVREAPAPTGNVPSPKKGAPDKHRLLALVPPEGIQRVEREQGDRINVWPHLLIEEFIAMLVMLAGLVIFSTFVNAPLRELANPNLTPNPSKAPWYFLGLQELLRYFHPMVAGIVIPTFILVGLAAIPFIDRNPSTRPGDRKLAITLFTMLFMFGATLTIIGSFFRGTGYNWVWPWAQGVFFEL
jgi:menaquinol-cytochrome c reductase cytochrome b/c subunit